MGKPLLAELLKSPEYFQVHAFVRKHFKESSPHKDDTKLVEHVIDFDKLVDSKEHSEEIRNVDANTIYITCAYPEQHYVSLVDGCHDSDSGHNKSYSGISRRF